MFILSFFYHKICTLNWSGIYFILFFVSVWQKLEEENADFFRAYYIRLKLKKQIILFNHLLEHHCHLSKYHPMHPKVPLAPIQNGIHPMPGKFSATSTWWCKSMKQSYFDSSSSTLSPFLLWWMHEESNWVP